MGQPGMIRLRLGCFASIDGGGFNSQMAGEGRIHEGQQGLNEEAQCQGGQSQEDQAKGCWWEDEHQWQCEQALDDESGQQDEAKVDPQAMDQSPETHGSSVCPIQSRPRGYMHASVAC